MILFFSINDVNLTFKKLSPLVVVPEIQRDDAWQSFHIPELEDLSPA